MTDDKFITVLVLFGIFKDGSALYGFERDFLGVFLSRDQANEKIKAFYEGGF